MTTRKLLSVLLILTASVGSVVAASAGPKQARQAFYEHKQQATSFAAWQRAETRLVDVRLEMTQPQFFEAMRMEVLAQGGKPVDAWVDGYLGPSSKEASENAPALDAGAPSSGRTLAFGYIDPAAQEQRTLVVVTFRDDRVSEIRYLRPAQIAQATRASAEP